MEIRVLDIRLLLGSKTTQAFVDIQLSDMEIKDFRIVQNGGKPHVKAPFTTYKDKTGQLRFRQIIDLPGEMRAAVDVAILGAYFREKEQTHGNHL
jgi:hypothetical protein